MNTGMERFMLLRNYVKTDCAQLARLFYDTVHTVNAKDYTQEQLAAWATGKVNLEAWNESLQAHHTVVRRMGDPKSVRYRNGAAGSTGDFIRRWQTGSDCHRRKLGLEQ